jgi:hypothetical protein
MTTLTSTATPFRLPFSFFAFFLRLPVHFIQDYDESLDGFGWLPCKLVWCPTEFFAEAEICEDCVWFLPSDGSDKKAVSSKPKALSLLTI